LRSGHAVGRVPQSDRPPPPPAQDGGPVRVPGSRARDQAPFFEFCHDRISTDVQHPCGITNPTGIHRHLDNLLFDRRRLPRVAIVQEERATRTAVLAAPVPLLALPGVAMADDVGPVTVRTVQDLENHDTTRSRWGYSVTETRREHSTSTPVRHLPPV